MVARTCFERAEQKFLLEARARASLLLEGSSRAEAFARLEISSRSPARARLARLARDCSRLLVAYLVAYKNNPSGLHLTLCMLHISDLVYVAHKLFITDFANAKMRAT